MAHLVQQSSSSPQSPGAPSTLPNQTSRSTRSPKSWSSWSTWSLLSTGSPWSTLSSCPVWLQWIHSTLPNSDKQLFVPQTCKDYRTQQTNQRGHVPNILLQLTALEVWSCPGIIVTSKLCWSSCKLTSRGSTVRVLPEVEGYCALCYHLTRGLARSDSGYYKISPEDEDADSYQ